MATPSHSGPRLAAPPEILADDPPVTSVMTRDIVALDAEALLPTALHVMATTGVRHLPVVDRGRCLGVLVEADLVRALAQDPRPFGAGVAATLRQWYRALEPARTAHPTVHVTTVVLDDDLVPILTALSTQATLLVLGRSRQPGNRPSPIDTLVRQAACPVLVVPPARRLVNSRGRHP
jgi:CBS domain-containing protein